MRTGEFNRLMKPFRQKIKTLSEEIEAAFKDADLSEVQGERVDAIVEALADAEQEA